MTKANEEITSAALEGSSTRFPKDQYEELQGRLRGNIATLDKQITRPRNRNLDQMETAALVGAQNVHRILADCLDAIDALRRERDEALAENAALIEETGSSDVENLKDMVVIGHSLMEKIRHLSESGATESGKFKGWYPAQCPTEIVTDLANALYDAERELTVLRSQLSTADKAGWDRATALASQCVIETCLDVAQREKWATAIRSLPYLPPSERVARGRKIWGKT